MKNIDFLGNYFLLRTLCLLKEIQRFISLAQNYSKSCLT